MKKISFILLLWVLFFAPLHAQIVTTVAGVDTQGYSGDGGPATQAKIGVVRAIALDAKNNIYISDGYRDAVVRKVNSAGIITTFAGNDTVGFKGDGGPATNAEIHGPEGIAVDKNGNVYFFDAANNRIRKVDTAGIINTFAGNGSTIAGGIGGPATAAGLGPGGGVAVCIDAAGNVYFPANHDICKVDNAGIFTIFAGCSVSGFGGDGGPATAAKLGYISQMQFDEVGNLFFADGGSRIRKINPSGIITTIAGNGTSGFSGDGGQATAAQLNVATGVFPDNCGNFYIADGYNNRIRKVDGHGIISTIAGNGYGASVSVGSFTGAYKGDGGPATAAEFYDPGIVYLDKNSNIYIDDGLNCCVRYIALDSCKSVLETPAQPSTQMERMALYPNPATDELNINGIMQGIKYRICSMTGAMMQCGMLRVGNNVLSLRYLAPGVYILEITGEDGGRKMLRVLKE